MSPAEPDKFEVQPPDAASLRAFTRHLIRDVDALEHMLETGLFETGTRRIGAEQEMFLVDDRSRPAPIIDEVMARDPDERIVTELSRFMIEFNAEPLRYEGSCLRTMDRALHDLIDTTREAVRAEGGDLLLAGTLPTVRISELTLDYMTQRPRYFALNDATMRLRDGPGQIHIHGIEELYVEHDSIMLEGCNTSFQMHLQVSPEEFAHVYNIAQAVAGPCLAAATNAPLLFGKRLWHETRIALFQQAADTRSRNLYVREMDPRVHFGRGWVEDSVLELFREDIAQFRVLLTKEFDTDPFDVLGNGHIPKLEALQLYNGTVYRWNRPCYGITDGTPHLRIENRILPAGPTAVDEVANAAFWFGVVTGLADRHDDIAEEMSFTDAKNNFISAARHGLASQFAWMDRQLIPARELILDHLLPVAEEGLQTADVDSGDISRYLGILHDRVRSGQTGSQWQLDSLDAMDRGRRSERMCALVSGMVRRQKEGQPVHEWTLASFDEAPSTSHPVQQSRVEEYMNTEIVTVDPQETAEFVNRLMEWKEIDHVLVEDHQNHLIGLVSQPTLMEHLETRDEVPESGIPIADIMMRNPVSAPPHLPMPEAITLFRERSIDALPIVRGSQLVGLLTTDDLPDSGW